MPQQTPVENPAAALACQELQKETRSRTAHSLGDALRDYLQLFYYEVVPAQRFENFLSACLEMTPRQPDARTGFYPPVLDRKNLAASFHLSPPGDTCTGAELAQRIRQRCNGQFSDEDRRRIFQCFDLTGLFKINSVLYRSRTQPYDLYPEIAALCAEGLHALPACGAARAGSRESWREWNAQASILRNAWFGHPDARTFAQMSQQDWLDGIHTLETLLTAVAYPPLSEPYQAVMALIQRAKRLTLFTVESLAADLPCQVETACTALQDAALSFREGLCYGVREEYLSAVSRYVRYQENEQKNKEMTTQLQQALEELQSIRQAPSAATIEAQTIQEKLLTQKLADVEPVHLLSQYTGGALDPRTLLELAQTHRFVLDDSLLRRAEGRAFVEQVLLRLLQRLGRPVEQALCVEATALYRMMREIEERDGLRQRLADTAAEEQYAAEHEALLQRFEQTTAGKEAYIFTRNLLHLGPVNYPDPIYTNEEALLNYLEDHCFERICVLTAGATSLPRALERRKVPFVVMARVSLEPGASPHTTCRLFRSTLPVIAARTDEPLLAGLREKIEQLYQKTVDEAQRARWKNEDVLAQVVQQIQTQDPVIPLSQRPATPQKERPQPTCGSLLATEEGQSVQLGEPLTEGGEIARGGEGTLYLCSLGEHYVVKIFHPEHLTDERRQKLTEMLSRNPRMPRVCWPLHLLYDEQHQFVGYLMQRVPAGSMPFSKTVLKIGGTSVQRELLGSWTRKDLVRTAQQTARIMARLHQKNIFMGDVNAGNFMVDPADSTCVFVVDTDSFQFGGYPCPVGTDEFTCPFVVSDGQTLPRPEGPVKFGTLLRSQQEEEFALAILLFEILFCGQNPFVSKGTADFLSQMRNRKFPYAVQTSDVWSVPDGDNWMIWKNLPPSITEAFTDTFVNWKPRSANQWAQLMKRYYESILKGDFSDEPAPVQYHEFHPENPFFVDVRCPSELCHHREFNLPKVKLEKLLAAPTRKNWDALFCRSCRSFLNLHGEDRPLEKTCSVCGKPFHPTIREILYHEADSPYITDREYLCEECKNPLVRCECCGSMYRLPHRQAQQIQNGKRVSLCPTCYQAEKLRVRCDRCGRNFEVAPKVFVGVHRNHRQLLCRDCLAADRRQRTT